MHEFELIDWIRERIGTERSGAAGVGDDAVLLREEDGRVWCVDTMVQDVHFRTSWSTWRDVGWKLLARNVSDMQAMGAHPTVFLLTLAIAETGHAKEIVEGIAEGIAAMCPAVRCVGGDTTRVNGPAMMTLSLMGRAVADSAQGEGLWLRSSARVGQGVWVNGELGLAAAGLSLLQSGRAPHAIPEVLLQAHRRPFPRPVSQWARAHAGVGACIDVSDGFVPDALHVCRASGVRMHLDVPLPGESVLQPWAQTLGVSVLDWQLAGGDDYVKLLTCDACPGPEWTRVGSVLRGDPGLTVPGAGGSPASLPVGFRHF